jgi:pimeloyl-ACP methyl ester carboxylesterase
VIGHSMGGGVAARFAIQHEERLRRLILVDASSLGAFRASIGLIVALVRFGARPSSASRERFLRHVLRDPARARSTWGVWWDALEAYDLEQAANKKAATANGRLVRTIGSRRIPIDQLTRIGVPVSLVWGTEDRLIRFRIAQRASSTFGWPLFPIRCGHGPQIEEPDKLSEVIRGITEG